MNNKQFEYKNPHYFSKALQAEIIEETSLGLELLAEAVKELLSEKRLERKHKISFEEAIEFFLENKPSIFQKAAMICESHPYSGYIFSQVYLNDRKNLVMGPEGNVIGRKLWVERLDDELAECFGDKDVVIVE